MAKLKHKPYLKNSARFLALCLSIALSLPNPAFALRQTGLEEQIDDQGKPVGPKAELVAALSASTATAAVPLSAPSLSIHAAGMEEWGEKVWDRLYTIAELDGVRPHLESLLQYTTKEGGRDGKRVSELWRKIINEIPANDEELLEVARAFQRRKILLYDFYGTLLFDNEHNEGVLLIGNTGIGKSTLAALLLDVNRRGQPQSTRWDFLGDDSLIVFADRGRLIVGPDPTDGLSTKLRSNHFGFVKVKGVEGFVPVGRIIRLQDPNPETQILGMGDFLVRLMSGPRNPSFLHPDILSAIEALPSIQIATPDDTDLEWFKTKALPRVLTGLEEKGTPAVGLKALLEYVAQEDVIHTIAVLAESGKTGDVTKDFPALEGLAKEAGFAGGVAVIMPTAASGEAVIGVPAEYAAQGIPVFVKKEWDSKIRTNLSELEATHVIRFVPSADQAFLVIGDGSVSVRPDQVFIRTNAETFSQVTPQLLAGLEERGLLKAGSVVMLYAPLKNSVMVFA